MIITIGTKSGNFPVPTSVLTAVRTLIPDMAGQVLACLWGGTVLELNTYLHAPCDLTPITYADDEGRRIYERSLRFVLLIAAGRLYPNDKLRIEHSYGQGVYIEMENRRLYAADVRALEGMMRDVIGEDLPFQRSQWSREQAIAHFRETGDEDKARLLGYRRYDFFNIYTAGGLSEYFYGAMLPFTGMLGVFALQPFAPGFLMQMPDKDNPSQAAQVARLPRHAAVFAQSNYWCRVLECATAADLNDLTASNRLRDFIRVNEAFHSKSLAEIAEDITRRGARAIFIAGPSSSGKTTFAHRLSIQLRVNGLKPVIISMDDFYLNRDDIPLEKDGQPDLEALSALDVDLLNKSIQSLLSGAETPMPRFNFAKKTREVKPVMMRVGPGTPLIIEGIHGLNPALHAHFDQSLLCRIYISQLTTINLDRHNRIRTTDARLLRRIVRDYQFRNTPAMRTLEMWDSVRRGEEKWIFPYQEQADIVFNSALHYELPVLKAISFGILNQVPQDSPQFVKCNRILKILNYLLPAPASVMNEIPPTSILREFIGGNTLYMEEE